MFWGITYAREDAITGAADTNQRFPGQYFDIESALHYNTAAAGHGGISTATVRPSRDRQTNRAAASVFRAGRRGVSVLVVEVVGDFDGEFRLLAGTNRGDVNILAADLVIQDVVADHKRARLANG